MACTLIDIVKGALGPYIVSRSNSRVPPLPGHAEALDVLMIACFRAHGKPNLHPCFPQRRLEIGLDCYLKVTKTHTTDW